MVKNAGVPETISPQAVEACVAFGSASLAVMAAREQFARRGAAGGPAEESYQDLVLAHEELRRLFATGTSEGVPELALTVMVLADRATSLLE